MNRITSVRHIEPWLETLERVCSKGADAQGQGMAWYFRPFDYDHIAKSIVICMNNEGQESGHFWIWNENGCLWGCVIKDLFTPNFRFLHELLLRVDPTVKGATRPLRDEAARIAGMEYGANIHYAVNVHLTRPGLSPEKESEVMIERQGYSPLSMVWVRGINGDAPQEKSSG